MLKQLELEREAIDIEAEIGAGDLDDRRAPDVRPDEPVCCDYPLAAGHVVAHLASSASLSTLDIRLGN